MSLFDGYGVTRIPDPRGSAQPDFASTKRVYGGSDGSLWTTSLDALQAYRDGKWTVRYRAPAGHRVLAAVPRGRRVMVLLEDGLREFDPDGERWREIRTAENSGIAPFRAMCPGAADELYITGEHGLAQLRISRDRGAFEWLKVNTDRDRLTHFDYPLPGTGELFAQGISSPGKRHVIVRWSRTRLQSVYDSEADNLRGWRGGGGLRGLDPGRRKRKQGGSAEAHEQIWEAAASELAQFASDHRVSGVVIERCTNRIQLRHADQVDSHGFLHAGPIPFPVGGAHDTHPAPERRTAEESGL